MEIRVRTAQEIAADRLTIEVNGARLYTAAQVGDAQASEAELVAAPLRRRIAELEARLERELSDARQSIAARDRLLGAASEERERFRVGMETAEAEAAQAREKVIELGSQVIDANQRARENREWAERAEARVAATGLELAESRRVIEFQAAQLRVVADAIHQPAVGRALGRVYEAWEPRTMAEAIRSARSAVGQHHASPEPAAD
jgi:hypothetical protein